MEGKMRRRFMPGLVVFFASACLAFMSVHVRVAAQTEAPVEEEATPPEEAPEEGVPPAPPEEAPAPNPAPPTGADGSAPSPAPSQGGAPAQESGDGKSGGCCG